MNLQQSIAYIEQSQEDVRRYCSEMRAASAKNERALWIYPISGLTAGAALFGAGAALIKLFGA